MSNELVISIAGDPTGVVTAATLPMLVERAGGAARFAWEEFFYAEHHNPHTQKAYMRAVKRFLAWAEGQGVELPRDHAGDGGAVPRRPGRLGRQAEPAPVGVTRFLRPAGEPACLRAQPGGVGQGRQGTGDRGQDAGDRRRAGLGSCWRRPTRARRGPAGPGDPRHAGLYHLPGRGGGQAPAEDFQQ